MVNKVVNISLWNKLVGHPEEFSMEHRAFNYVCFITFSLLIFSLVFDLYIVQSFMSVIIALLLAILGVMYYFSRFERKYKVSVIVFIVCCYAALSLNYFNNEGINGPTLCLFSITLMFIALLTKPSYHFIFIFIHLSLVVSLLTFEYYFPNSIPNAYPSKVARFMDMATTAIMSLVFIYAVTNYMRNYYDEKRILADERALAISEKNKELERVNNEKNKIFSIVSHDLKAPLESIREYLTMLSEFDLSEEDKKEIQGHMLEQTKYTSDLLGNLLAWSKSQIQGIQVNPVNLDLYTFLENVSERKSLIAERKEITISTEVDKDIFVVCDEDMLKIIVRNLFNNAIKFTPNGGKIFIKGQIQGKEAVLSIKDNGIGMTEEKKKELFTLKTQSTFGTNNEKGIGLGLLMCKEFIEAQHGRIWFESTPGKGSTFYFSLPLA
jgi:two-component system sensor histidine kinase/response regulator